MTAAKLLRPVRLAGRTVFEALGSSPLSASGNSIVVRLDKSVLETVGLVDEDRGPVDGVEARATYQVDPEREELSVELTMPIQDDAVVNEWLQESGFSGADSDVLAD